ncbi:MAG TPA: hypothetical protein VKX96_02575 [Chloroflexota bacterium]|nr:hypothetical protein [Chloroflexota bacterium]
MQSNGIFALALVLAALSLLIGVYYLIPNVYHVLATHDVMQTQIKHALAFFALAIVLVVGARFARNNAPVK